MHKLYQIAAPQRDDAKGRGALPSGASRDTPEGRPRCPQDGTHNPPMQRRRGVRLKLLFVVNTLMHRPCLLRF